MWRGQLNGHWEILRRPLEKEVFWPWSRSPGAPGAEFRRKRRGPFICLQSVSNPRTGGCTWESDLYYILSRSYRLLPRTYNFITLFMSCQNVSYFASQACRQPQIIKGRLPFGFNYCFSGERRWTFQSWRFLKLHFCITFSWDSETCNLFLSFQGWISQS